MVGVHIAQNLFGFAPNHPPPPPPRPETPCMLLTDAVDLTCVTLAQCAVLFACSRSILLLYNTQHSSDSMVVDESTPIFCLFNTAIVSL